MLWQTACHRRNIGFCWCEAGAWLVVFFCFFSRAWSFSRPSLLGIHRKVSSWRCFTTLWKHVICVSSTLSAGGAYTMNSFTSGVEGQTGWGVVMLIWHTWKCSSNLLESFMIRSGVPRNIRGAEGRETDAKAWIFLHPPPPPPPKKGNISKCNKQRT